ncbi:hypothetical protein B0T14DRAFT_147747 [Immersiella caudata]|uniref:EXPERA domain-containing protein n=1 Tax=Immersiella caudata TaxID=314043 RepID=A0AA40C298_9PEZI|nr:hypothetical protein B0T14DRAFT_147747 [Immersiella caudata]
MVSTRSASAALNTPRRTSPSAAITPLPSPTKRASRQSASSTSTVFTHTPTPLTLLWLAASIPLVFWDALFVFLRPHSFPGGKYHWPIWSAYAIQSELDYTYGIKKWEEGDGFNGAQSAMNIVESGIYLVYLGLWWSERKQSGKGELKGKTGAAAVVVLYTGLVATFGKTVLYCEYSTCPLCASLGVVHRARRTNSTASGVERTNADMPTLGLNEYFSGFANIGHNSVPMLGLWLVTNGVWIVFPAIIGYQTANEIINALAKTPAGSRKSE